MWWSVFSYAACSYLFDFDFKSLRYTHVIIIIAKFKHLCPSIQLIIHFSTYRI